MTAVIFTGLQASGKTTYYNTYFAGYTHINLDTLHTRNNESRMLEECLALKKSFVVDNTNPTRESRKGYIEKAGAAGYRIIGYYFRSSIDECIKRNQNRTGKSSVPVPAIAGTYKKLEIPSFDEGFDKLYYVHIGPQGFITEEWDDSRGTERKHI